MKYIIIAGRILFSSIFLITFVSHFEESTIQYAASKGVPFATLLVPASGLLELVGAISIALGVKAKWGAWLIVLFLVPVTLSLHSFWTIDDEQLRGQELINFLKNLSILGGALLITQFDTESFRFTREDPESNY